MSVRRICGLFGLAIAGLVADWVLAENPSGALRIEVIAAPNFVVDSNVA